MAECAAPFLRVGGWLIVSEPPGAPTAAAGPGRPLAGRPARPARAWYPAEFVHEEFGYQVLRQAEPCPERFPRRDGVPAKRPLF